MSWMTKSGIPLTTASEFRGYSGAAEDDDLETDGGFPVTASPLCKETVIPEVVDLAASPEFVKSSKSKMYFPVVTTPLTAEPSLFRSVSSFGSENEAPLLSTPPQRQAVEPMFIETVNIPAPSHPNTDRNDVNVQIGNVTNLTWIDVVKPQRAVGAVTCEPRVEEIAEKFVKLNGSHPRNTVPDTVVMYCTGNKPISSSVLGLPTKWYYLIITLVALSGAGCIVSAVGFSVRDLWSTPDDLDSQASESADSSTGRNEELIVMHKNWWYLMVALVSLSCINLVSTAMFSFNKYRNSGVSPRPSFTDVDTVPNKFLLDAPRMINRSMWLAQPAVGKLDPNPLPVDRVIVGHTATEEALTLPHCCHLIRNIQMNHIEARQWYDIGFNFLIGGDGSVYFGRGWDWVGAHTKGHNLGTLGIAMVGTFTHKLPNDGQMTALRKLLKLGVMMKKIKKNYSLITQCQLKHSWSPERRLAEELAKWPHFDLITPII